MKSHVFVFFCNLLQILLYYFLKSEEFIDRRPYTAIVSSSWILKLFYFYYQNTNTNKFFSFIYLKFVVLCGNCQKNSK